ncbi:MAG TPA: hypothetical protein VM054_11680 [bacterium]|nr:hypothetical protein [bacterium]
MGKVPVVVFCEICGAGINLVRGDNIYKCRVCGKRVCAKCWSYDHDFGDRCNECAEPFIEARRIEEEREKELKKRIEEQERIQKQIQQQKVKKEWATRGLTLVIFVFIILVVALINLIFC